MPNLNESEKNQQVTEIFLYYAIGVDSTILVAICSIVSEQANTMNTTMNKVKKFLNYAASHQDVIFMYHASDVILAFHSAASYLIKSKAISRVGGNFSYRRMTKPQEKWGIHNQGRQYRPTTGLHTQLLGKISIQEEQKQWKCVNIG